jgi:hypothetical protein
VRILIELDNTVLLDIHTRIPAELQGSRAFLREKTGLLSFEHNGKSVLTLRPELRDYTDKLIDRFNGDSNMRYDTIIARMAQAAVDRPFEERIGLTVDYGGPVTSFSMYVPGDEPEEMGSLQE